MPPRRERQAKQVVGRKKTGEGASVASAVLTTSQGPEELKAPPTELTNAVVAEEASEELADQAEINDLMKRKAKMANADGLTRFLMEHYKLAYLAPIYNHMDSRFPFDDYRQVKVSRYYPSLALMVDIVPAGWEQDKIDAKKYAIEQMGFQYTWKKPNEDSEQFDSIVFFERMKPLKEKPAFEFTRPQTKIRLLGVPA